MAKYIESIKTEYIGKRDQEISDLENLIFNRVGVGDHANLSTDIKKKIENIEKLDSQIDTIEKYFFNKEESPELLND